MSFSPNLKVLTDWRSSLNVAFSVLRRISFIVTSDFSFGDFDPQTNFGTMTSTNYLVNSARYFRINNMMWYWFDIQSTLAAVFALDIKVTLPGTAAGTTGQFQAATGVSQNGGAAEGGVALIEGTTNTLLIYRSSFANYSAGAWRARINGFLEVI